MSGSAILPAEYKKCPSCQTPFRGKFCYSCGEKKLEREEMTVAHFFGSVWNALTFTDVKFIRSVRALLFDPGKLTREYFAGRRKLYTAPIALFFFINLVYFIYQPVDALNSTLTSQTTGQFYSDWAEQVVKNKMESEKLDKAGFDREYNHMSSQVSKLFLVVFVLFFALGVALVNVWKKELFYFHLITATHYVSFTILGLLILAPLIATTIIFLYLLFFERSDFNFDPNAWYVTVPVLSVLLVYAFKMQQRLYSEAVIKSILKAFLLVVAFAVAVLLYRLFLFVIVMAFV